MWKWYEIGQDLGSNRAPLSKFTHSYARRTIIFVGFRYFAGTIKSMEIRLLKYFLAVAKEQSITKAAKILHITQPTLSRQMHDLEEETGVTLFLRGTKKISLTNEG